MRNRILPLTALACAAAAVTAVIAPAAADAKKRPKYVKQQFEVRILGVQDTNWGTLSDDQAENCRTKVVGSGSEHLIFRTKAPHKLSVVASRNLGFYSYGNLSIDGTASVLREGYENVTVEDPCEGVAQGDGDGGPVDQPPAPDCGEKEAPIGLELSFTRETVELVADTSRSTDELFLNCPVHGIAYGNILTYAGLADGGARTIEAKLPLRDLVRSKKRVFQVSARGTLVDNYATTSTNTKINWTIKLTRVKRR